MAGEILIADTTLRLAREMLVAEPVAPVVSRASTTRYPPTGCSRSAHHSERPPRAASSLHRREIELSELETASAGARGSAGRGS